MASRDRGRTEGRGILLEAIAGLRERMRACEDAVSTLDGELDGFRDEVAVGTAATEDRIATQSTEAQARVESLVKRVVELEHTATTDAGARLAANEAGVLAQNAMNKAVAAWQQFGNLPGRVTELEQRPVCLDEIDAALHKIATGASAQVEGLRKRTSEKFGIRDRKIEDLYGRVGVLIERTDALAPTQNTTKPKPRKKVA